MVCIIFRKNVGGIMEDLSYLRARLRDAEYELKKITIKKYGSVPWAPGVQDQFKSESYSYDQYTDVSKAYRLKALIEDLKHQIDTYPERARARREREEELRESQITKYKYTVGNKEEITTNPAIAARYNAQHRLFGMNKLQRAIKTLTGQKKKFEKLWHNADTIDEKTQEQVAAKLNKMFR